MPCANILFNDPFFKTNYIFRFKFLVKYILYLTEINQNETRQTNFPIDIQCEISSKFVQWLLKLKDGQES
jgi:hypothetical protein